MLASTRKQLALDSHIGWVRGLGRCYRELGDKGSYSRGKLGAGGIIKMAWKVFVLIELVLSLWYLCNCCSYAWEQTFTKDHWKITTKHHGVANWESMGAWAGDARPCSGISSTLSSLAFDCAWAILDNLGAMQMKPKKVWVQINMGVFQMPPYLNITPQRYIGFILLKSTSYDELVRMLRILPGNVNPAHWTTVPTVLWDLHCQIIV